VRLLDCVLQKVSLITVALMFGDLRKVGSESGVCRWLRTNTDQPNLNIKTP